MTIEDVVVVGAGPAGLAAAAALRAAGRASVVVDKAPDVGSAWRAHYERLKLHTERALSSLPGFDLPERYGKWVPRASVVEYLEDYARHHELKLKLSTAVERIERDGDAWRVFTSAGPLAAKAVVVATGYNHTPRLPEWPGTFTGELVHSAAYRNAKPYRDRDVLVVGAGNSGAEIAVDLVEGGAKSVSIAVRTPPNILRRELLGISAQRLGVMLRRLPVGLVDPIASAVARLSVGDLTRHGMPRAPRGAYTRAREGQIPILDVGFIDALKAGEVKIVPAVRGFEGAEVLLEGGARLRPDAVIAATGFARGLEKLVGHLGVLDERGLPRAHGPDSPPGAPRLHFIGYTNPISGNLRELKLDALKIAQRLAGGRADAARV